MVLRKELMNEMDYNHDWMFMYKASAAGHARAQYQLALCLHQGRGVAQSLEEAVLYCSAFIHF